MPDLQLPGVEVARGRVRPEWIDVNNHMNVAYYILVFDQGIDALWDRIGITSEYIADNNNSTFAVESHVTWQREIAEADPYVVTSQILAYDAKRIHQFMRLYHAEQHYLSATAEWMSLHVDLDVRRVAPWPQNILEGIAAFVAEQGDQSWPEEAGRVIRVENPVYAGKDL